MKLVTWNVNSLKARLPRVLELLDAHAPDVLCLQETKTEPEAFPVAELRAAGYEAVHHSGGRWAGVAILAPAATPPRDPVCGLDGTDPAEARWIEATVDDANGDGGELRVASVYVPNGRGLDSPELPRKLAFLDAMRARPVDVLMGDLNVTRGDVDVYDPAAFAQSTHVTPDERERLEALLGGERGEPGLVDAYRRLHPDEVGYTWWDYRQGHFHRKLGLRIDYVLVGAALAPRLERCGIDRGFRKGPKPSDHAPLVAELAPPPPRSAQ